MISVVSKCTPPFLRKPSTPARSVRMWKFTARRPRETPKRTAFATSQPAMSTSAATMSRGSRSPSCRRETRTGSSRTSTLSMLQEGNQPLHGDADPVRAIGELVAQLVEHFLELGELQQPLGVFDRGVDAAAG